MSAISIVSPATGPSPCNAVDPGKHLGSRLAGAIHVRGPVVAVKEPTEFDSVGDPLLHLVFRGGKTVAGRHHFDHEFRAHGQELAALLARQPRQPFLGDPGRVGQRVAPLGRMNAIDEPNVFPWWLRMDQLSNAAIERTLRWSESPPAGGTITISPCAVRSNRASGFAMQKA